MEIVSNTFNMSIMYILEKKYVRTYEPLYLGGESSYFIENSFSIIIEIRSIVIVNILCCVDSTFGVYGESHHTRATASLQFCCSGFFNKQVSDKVEFLSTCSTSFEFNTVLLVDQLQTTARQSSLPCYQPQLGERRNGVMRSPRLFVQNCFNWNLNTTSESQFL